MDYNKKGYKIALIALIFALIALSISGMPGTDGTNGTNAVLGTLTFVLHNTSSDVTIYPSLKMDSVIVADVNKTWRSYTAQNGDVLIQNFTSLPMGLTLIPAGAIDLHIHAKRDDPKSHIDRLWFDVGIVNATGGNFSSIGISLPSSTAIGLTETEIDVHGVMLESIVNTTDRMALRVWVNQSGDDKTNTTITLYMDDLTLSRLTIPAIPIDLTGIINNVGNNTANIDLKVNKSGDNITGVLITNVTTGYTGLGYTIYEGGRSSAKSKVRYVINDVNGAFNMRVNIKDDLTPDESYPTSGFAFGMRPSIDDFIVSRLHWNSEGILDGNELVFQVAGNTSAYFSGNISSSKLAGTGNAYACVDSTGKLFRSAVACV